MSEQKYFPKGLYFNLPHQNAPDFVKGQVSIKVADLQAYLQKVQGEWLNIDLKVSKDGKAYAEVNTFKPDNTKKPKVDEPVDKTPQPNEPFDNSDDLPF